MDNVNEYFLSNVWPVLLSVTVISALPVSPLIPFTTNNFWLLTSNWSSEILDEVAETLYVLPLVPTSYWSAPLKNCTKKLPSVRLLVTTDSDVAENTWASFVKNTVNASEPDCTPNISILSSTLKSSQLPPVSLTLTSYKFVPPAVGNEPVSVGIINSDTEPNPSDISLPFCKNWNCGFEKFCAEPLNVNGCDVGNKTP